MSAGHSEGAASAVALNRAIFVRAAKCICAVPLPHVLETMRPLPVQPITGAPPFVRGLAVIRGQPVPVVDLDVLVAGGSGEATRLVLLAVGERRIALLVNAVIGVYALDAALLQETPPLLGQMGADSIEKVGALDAQLLVVLRASRVIPDELWAALERRDR